LVDLLVFHAYINEMHGSWNKIPIKISLVWQRCAGGFNSVVKGLNRTGGVILIDCSIITEFFIHTQNVPLIVSLTSQVYRIETVHCCAKQHSKMWTNSTWFVGSFTHFTDQALHYFCTSALEGVERVSVTPRPPSTPWKDPVPIVQEAGWDSGPGEENLVPTGIRFQDRPALSQSLCWLSYPAHWTHCDVYNYTQHSTVLCKLRTNNWVKDRVYAICGYLRSDVLWFR
jgi:hypothetical protein